jgi:RHS repeat-associated protein
MGNKVEENVNGTIHEYVSAFGVSAQMTGQTQNSTLVDLPGGAQALYSGGALQRFRFPDWQGTIRAESDPANRVFTESLSFAPFGERYAVKGTPYNVDSFTGKPDEIVSDEYDFLARQEHSGQGRWISPDPIRGTGNKYVYANNNPLSTVDLFGLFGYQYNSADVAVGIDWGEWADPPSESHGPQTVQTDGQFQFGGGSSGGAGASGSSSSAQTPEQMQAQASANTTAGQPAQQAQQQNTVTASVNGTSVTYTYPDGSRIVLTGTHPFRDNNPGDLRSGHSSIGRDGGFAIYASLDAGVNALGATLTGKYADSTIADTMKAFAPASDGNDPVKYAATLASAVGVPVTTKISALTPAQLMTFQYNIAIAEGYNAAGNTASYFAPPQ